MSLESGEEVGNLIVTFRGHLLRSHGKSAWEISAEGVDQSLLVVALKCVVGDKLSASRELILWGWESTIALEPVGDHV